MDHALIEKYAAPVPRYTSYPTAPHFTNEVNNGVYAEWLAGFQADDKLSLYIHIPFCDRLCWFCGCNTKQTLKYAPVQAYLQRLFKEIELVATKLPDRLKVVSVHLGGGSPTLLQSADFARLKDVLHTHFDFATDAEISIEIDPSDVTDDQIKGMVEFGLTRASIGVQDFSDVVQQAINRPQSFEVTRDVVNALRAHNIQSINLDVLYGLPHQTLDRLMDTVAKTASLQPDRIALFGYAHVPWMKTHQKMIDEAALPDTVERFEHAMKAAEALAVAGYDRVGFDHFALPHDKMAIAARDGTLRRNFQGYTVDPADAMIGFGGSAIGQNRHGYIQNIVPTGQYQAQIDKGELAVGKGYALTEDDRLRGHVIEQLMCQFFFDKAALVARFGAPARQILREANVIAAQDHDGFIENDEERFSVVGDGQPFVRAIAAKFDIYFGQGNARHSKAV